MTPTLSDGCRTRTCGGLGHGIALAEAGFGLRVLLLIAPSAAWHAIGAQRLYIGQRCGSFTPGDDWRARVGSDLKHMRHYCRGLWNVLLADTGRANERDAG